MSETYNYEPNYAVPPWRHVIEYCQHKSIDALEVLEETECDVKPITIAMAERLEQLLDAPAQLWLNLQHNYDATLQRIEISKQSAERTGKTEQWAFTFGVGHPLRKRYVIIDGTYEQARKKMVSIFGRKWCGQYSIEQIQDARCRHNYSEIILGTVHEEIE